MESLSEWSQNASKTGSEKQREAKKGHGNRKLDPGGVKKVVQGGMALSKEAASLRARATGKGREGVPLPQELKIGGSDSSSTRS